MKWHKAFLSLIGQCFSVKMWMDLVEGILGSETKDLHAWANQTLLDSHGLKSEPVFWFSLS